MCLQEKLKLGFMRVGVSLGLSFFICKNAMKTVLPLEVCYRDGTYDTAQGSEVGKQRMLCVWETREVVLEYIQCEYSSPGQPTRSNLYRL